MTNNISVVVVSLEGEDGLDRCLKSLIDQKKSENIEILVPCDDRFKSVTALQQKFPEARILKIEGIRTYAELRSAGFLNATASIIALTEDQCIPDPDWCERIMEAHNSSYAAIGGAVDKFQDSTESLLNWAVYFCDYSRYANPVSEGVVRHLTDSNVSYKRDALTLVSQVWKQEFHETVVHGALQQQGKQLWISPRIIVKQQRSMHFGKALRERYAFGRLFGSTRIEKGHLRRRIFFAVFAVFLPVLLTWRITINVFEKKRYRSEFARCLPLIILLNAFWSFGEFVGYLTASADPSLSPREAPV